MKRFLPALTLTGLLLVSGCGAPATTTGANIADEAFALQQVGYDAPAAASGAGDAPSRRALRRQLRANTLHGEVVVQSKDGPKTIVVQRGEVTAVSGDELTVKSADGFSLTWAVGDKLRVVQNRKAADQSAIKTGGQIGVAGVKDGEASRARLVVLK